jgi:type I restriction enzyme S subunit
MGEWKTYRLGEIVTIKGGKRLPKGVNLIKIRNSHPYIRIRDIGKTKTIELDSTFEYVDDDTQKTIARYIVQEGDILISIVGTIGLVGIVGKSLDSANLTENCVKLTNLRGVERDFLFYFLKSEYGQNETNKGIVGAVQAKLPIKNIENIKIPLPSLEEQRRIAGILGSLDDKIELNRRINANLEAQAQALFRSWFVDFEPFRDGPFVDSELGKIPQGWKICRLKDATKEIIRGFTSKYVERSDLINLNQKVNKGQYLDRQYYKFLNPEIAIPTNKFAQQNDILLNSLGQGTLGRVHYYGELTPNIVIDQHITIIRANNTTFQPSFIYLFLSSNKVQHSIEGMVTGSTGMQMLNISQVREMNILQPDVNTMNKFHNIVQPFFVEIRKNNSETEIIAKIRDTLLPKLMAGEISC